MTEPGHASPDAAPAGAPRRGPRRRGAIALTTIFSLAGLAMGIAAIVMMLLGGGGIPGKGLGAYDLDTPEGAARFPLAVKANADLLAELEHDQAESRLSAKKDKLHEAVDSFECGGTTEYDGKVVVLYKHKDKDKTRYRTRWLEKKDDGRYWDADSPSLGKDDAKEIREKISKWRSQGSDSVGTVGPMRQEETSRGIQSAPRPSTGAP